MGVSITFVLSRKARFRDWISAKATCLGQRRGSELGLNQPPKSLPLALCCVAASTPRNGLLPALLAPLPYQRELGILGCGGGSCRWVDVSEGPLPRRKPHPLYAQANLASEVEKLHINQGQLGPPSSAVPSPWNPNRLWEWVWGVRVWF